jgi:hypothetical protein
VGSVKELYAAAAKSDAEEFGADDQAMTPAGQSRRFERTGAAHPGCRISGKSAAPARPSTTRSIPHAMRRRATARVDDCEWGKMSYIAAPGSTQGREIMLRNATHTTLAAGAILALGALGGCTDAPLCKYWSDAHIGKGMDPSEVPMLPDNPFWLSKTSPAAPPASDGPCAGEPPPSAVSG